MKSTIKKVSSNCLKGPTIRNHSHPQDVDEYLFALQMRKAFFKYKEIKYDRKKYPV